MRFAAVGLGLSFFVAVEGVCRVFDLGSPDAHDDPFVGFSDLQPLFVHDRDAGVYRIPEARRKFFVEDSFPDRKRPGTFRVFCLGGSTVQGRPFAKETSFTTWLQLALASADPDTNWEVVNCGGISYASYRLVPIMEECLQYKPDLFIVVTGHNEFLEDRTYANVRDRPAVLSVPHRHLARLRSYHVYRRCLLWAIGRDGPETPPSTLASEVDAMLDYHEGIRAYHRDEAWRAGVVRHFEVNLDRMARIAGEHGVPLVLVLPPSNLMDTPPFKSEHRPGLTEAELARFNQFVEEATSQPALERRRAVTLLERAREIDPQFAGVRFRLGTLYAGQGRVDDARSEFLAAREEDICPLRIIRPMEEALRATARAYSLPLVDAHALLESETEHGILDGSMLLDHVHPSIEGHQRIALALADTLADMNLVAPALGWREDAQRAFQRHLDTLPTLYFLKGQQRLHNLREWSKGRADGPKVEERFPERVEE